MAVSEAGESLDTMFESFKEHLENDRAVKEVSLHSSFSLFAEIFSSFSCYSHRLP
ncbi:unnamed protein product [Gongylonema pulchrum]|uniref:FH2 domain-containing protein n=1 Tax=Gongylonema pulchrum TaxID=637853 RepID=A0A183D0G0_9BILA|nr:unnamed protein product [Gongylonema pulchrum]